METLFGLRELCCLKVVLSLLLDKVGASGSSMRKSFIFRYEPNEAFVKAGIWKESSVIKSDLRHRQVLVC